MALALGLRVLVNLAMPTVVALGLRTALLGERDHFLKDPVVPDRAILVGGQPQPVSRP